MRPIDVVRLVVLAAIWGASFMFQRQLVAPLGPYAIACLRILLGGAALTVYLSLARVPRRGQPGLGRYVVIGLVNSAIPFLLFALAARHIPAGYMAILNATAPVFGLMIGALWLGERPQAITGLGIALGIGGVAMVAWRGPVELTPARQAAIGGCLVAACCYAIAGHYIRHRARDLHPMWIAASSQLLGGLILAPAMALDPPAGPIDDVAIARLAALALLCSAVAYLLYFRLLADCGPERALTVTFLIPVFGIAWGALILDEELTGPMLAGAGLVVIGTALALRR